MKVSLNGSIVDRENAVVPAESDGLYYGAGCFDTFMSYHGKFLHLTDHIRRLNLGVSYLTGADEDFFAEDLIRAEISELLKVNDLYNKRVRVRVQVSIGERLGYVLPMKKKPVIVSLITATPAPDVEVSPLQLKTVKTTVVPASSKPAHLKLSNMLHYRQAGIEAKNKGADDALMLTLNGLIAETSIANIFWEKDGVVYTPSASCDILAGVTRSIVLKLMKKSVDDVREGEFTLKDLKSASQVWICNSLKEIVWVSKIDDRSFMADTPLRKNLLQSFSTYKEENLT